MNFTIKKIMFQMNKTAKIRFLIAIWKSQKKAKKSLTKVWEKRINTQLF
jgi:hypothetical protein